jgi:D-alanyl-D-alanine carboxypeptidase
MISEQYRNRIELAHQLLRIPAELVAGKRLPLHPEAQDLVLVEADADGREYHLMPQAAEAWRALKQAALQDGVILEIVSAFRSIERQIDIIRAKQERGMAIETILTLSAPPGYSEHHTGRAVDINTPGCAATEEPFELTGAFAWLTQHAGRFGFRLSYPRGNDLGFIYEPWHWCFHPAGREHA